MNMQVNQKNWQELIRPSKIDITPGKDKRRVATVVAEPLERGFGTTLGNALRRILLSSLQGAAVTSVHIDGVLHEFSSIAGVREDVTDIILNIKEIAFAMHAEGPKRLSLRKEGPGVVRAGDIQQTSDIQVLNPEHVICTLDQGAEIRMEFTVNNGKGYVPAEKNRPEDAPIGLIPVDSIYSPVRKVSYRVEATREGQVLDYDKLIMTVETNGAVTPDDAVAYAARILQDQISVFINFSEPVAHVVEEASFGTAVQRRAAQEGGRVGTLGAFGQLPEERQHCLHRRSDPEDRSRNAAHAELRPQVLERNQGSARTDGLASRHGSAELATRKHRRARQEARSPLLSYSQLAKGLQRTD